MISSQNKTTLLILLAGMSALGQFANSIAFPSFPAISAFMQVSTRNVQVLLAVFLVTFAFSLLIFGVIADQLGRKPAALAALLIFLFGCIVGAIARNMEILYLGRILQAAGSAGTMAVSRAVARDYYEGKALAKAAAIMTIVYSAAPGLSPLLGGMLQQISGWQAGFWFSFMVGVVILAAVMRMEETVLKPMRLTPRHISTVYSSLFRSSRFTIYVVTSGCAMGGLFAYLAAAPFIFQKDFHVSAARFGIYPAIAIFGFVLGSLFVKKMVDRLTTTVLTTFGLYILVGSSMLMLLFCLIGQASAFSFTLSMFFYVSGLGIIFPLSLAELLKEFPASAAAAAAMGGFVQMLGGAVGALLASCSSSAGIFSIPATLLPLSLAGLIFFLMLQSKLKDVRKPDGSFADSQILKH